MAALGASYEDLARREAEIATEITYSAETSSPAKRKRKDSDQTLDPIMIQAKDGIRERNAARTTNPLAP